MNYINIINDRYIKLNNRVNSILSKMDQSKKNTDISIIVGIGNNKLFFLL